MYVGKIPNTKHWSEAEILGLRSPDCGNLHLLGDSEKQCFLPQNKYKTTIRRSLHKLMSCIDVLLQRLEQKKPFSIC